MPDVMPGGLWWPPRSFSLQQSQEASMRLAHPVTRGLVFSGALMAVALAAHPSRAQYYYGCPAGFYFAPGYGCVPYAPGYAYAPYYYDYAPFGYAWGGGWGGWGDWHRGWGGWHGGWGHGGFGHGFAHGGFGHGGGFGH